ncbi:hypothetical protein LOK49_LG14G01646 [Camellia lanceoleosa]|uniref:Uncharacterized protein n=1 Tax=Camellia lanceoleosa TaxID=1840588 RepID=A0ACC0FAM2_9ERIC|nr:hypothetical protein LOK49_LG14G01646 [Camellia lanceoleosa]
MLTGKSLWNGNKIQKFRIFSLTLVKGMHGLLKLPNENEVSDEAIDFLKGCFARKAMDRLTAQMLLNHPFVAGLGEDNEDNKEELPVEDSEEKCCATSILSLSDYEADDECSLSYFPDD